MESRRFTGCPPVAEHFVQIEDEEHVERDGQQEKCRVPCRIQNEVAQEKAVSRLQREVKIDVEQAQQDHQQKENTGLNGSEQRMFGTLFRSCDRTSAHDQKGGPSQ